MRSKALLLKAASVIASLSTHAAAADSMDFNTTIFQVNPVSNAELPLPNSLFQSFSLARDPLGNLYYANAAGSIFEVIPPMPIGNTGFTQIADLSYASGGLWGFSDASNTLFFFDLGINSVTYSLPITSGLAGYTVTGVTQQPSTGDIFLSGNTGLNQDTLFRLDLNTASANFVGNMLIQDQFSYISDIEFDASGNLLAQTFFHREFDYVDPNTAATTFISTGPHRDTTGLAVIPPTQIQPVPEPATWAGAALIAALAARRCRKR